MVKSFITFYLIRLLKNIERNFLSRKSLEIVRLLRKTLKENKHALNYKRRLKLSIVSTHFPHKLWNTTLTIQYYHQSQLHTLNWIVVFIAPQKLLTLFTALNKKKIRLNDALKQPNSSNLKGNVKQGRISVLKEVLHMYILYYIDMTYHKWQSYSYLQTRFLTSINHEFQKSWITDFQQLWKTVSLLRCITNKQNKNVNSHKQKHDHHQN